MPKDRFQELCKTETLKIAINYVFDDQKDDFIPDVFRHQDYLFNLEENLRRLARNLANGTYRPRPLREIDVPKSGLSVRPGSSLDIEDHIVSFGIAYLLAPILDRQLPPNVFHFRVRKKGDRPHASQLFENEHRSLLKRAKRKQLQIFDEWYEVWPDFMGEAQTLYGKEGFTFLVESDITAYFENISHPLLADVLRQHAPQQLPLINLQMEMVSAWATPSLWGVRPHRGIPQGNEVSSWLGTLFLVQMDVELLKLQRRGLIKFLRYVDDLKVFTKDYKALFGDGELFDTQYLYLVPLLRQTEALAHNDRPKLLALGRRKELHWAARAEAIITLMLFPLEEAHYKRLRLLYEQESSTYVKKAILALYLKAPFATKQSVMKATITEPEEETNRFRKFLWALANSPEHAKPSLKIIGNREKDPARLLVSLHGALQSSDLNVLRQVRQIAQTDAKQATSAASRQAFEQVLQHADSKLANLTKGKAKS